MIRKIPGPMAVLAILGLICNAYGDNSGERLLEGGPKFPVCSAADQAGNLWVGTEGAGLACFTPATEKWTTFTAGPSPDGAMLGDNFVYALACDRKNRIWAGHLNHGVSVYNGEKIQSYSNWEKKTGPLGSRVYAIAVSPVDGDVWIATDAGVTRYSEAGDSWSHYTRAEGLPADQMRGIAFDSGGDIYLASACEGVVIGRAADHFTKWEQVKGEEEMPLTAHGPGVPSMLANCITVDARGVIYVGTTRGLAVSADKGKTWRFVRGRDWGNKARESYSGVPDNWEPQGEGLLNEDWIDCMQVDPQGMLWLGYRKTGFQRINPETSEVLYKMRDMPDILMNNPTNMNIPMMVNVLDVRVVDRPLIGRYGGGLWTCDDEQARIPRKAPEPVVLPIAPLPKGAAPKSEQEIAQMITALGAIHQVTKASAYLGEDWNTQGDWVGRYGRQFAFLNGLGMGTRDFAVPGAYSSSLMTGPNFPGNAVYSYVATSDSKDRRVLYDPVNGKRAHGENNDGTFNDETYVANEGPDLWVRFKVPAGVHRLTLFFLNYDGQVRKNAFRDFVLELRHEPVNEDAANEAADLTVSERFAVTKLPVEAKARVSSFQEGVYESFLVRDKGLYWLKITRNHSHITKINGMFVDRLDLPPEKEQKAFLWQVQNDPPELSPDRAGSPAALARDVWAGIAQRWDCVGVETVAMHFGLEAYRMAADKDVDAGVLRLGRWKLHLWSQEDRNTFDQRMNEGFQKLQQNRN